MQKPLSAKTLVRKIARRLGFQWLTDWEARVRRDAELTNAMLRAVLRRDTNCIDVGANRGVFLEKFVQLAPNGRHIAIEPIPYHAEVLAKRYPGVEVLECALSNRTGEATFFHVPDRDAWSGLERQQYPNGEEPVEIRVSIRRMDDVVDPDRPVGFIKIDVEGAEFEVLQGATETLKRWRPTVLFEHAKLHNANYGTTPQMIFDLIAGECGLQIQDLTLSRTYGRQEFVDIYERSHASNYDRRAQTNFVARPL